MPNQDPKPISAYQGENRYNDWVEDYLGVELTEEQKEIGRSLHEHELTLVIGANGFGKSWAVACFILAFLFQNYPASVLATSGTYGKLRRTVCKPVDRLHSNAPFLPGEYKKAPPRIEIEDEPDIYFQAASPRDAGELEGVHNTYTLGVIEELDKDDVDAEVIDSMQSLLTDHRDRLLAIGNPPRDAANVAADMMADDSPWHVLEYSSFDSHNVRAEQQYPGEPMTDDGEYVPELQERFIDGLVTLDRIRKDWVSWNGTDWPGLAEAKKSGRQTTLDQRWYRRRLGVVPPDTADAHRPFSITDVEDAYKRDSAQMTVFPQGLALDVARTGGDANAFTAIHGETLHVKDYWRGTDHTQNEENVRDIIDKDWECELAVDAIGEGSALADRVSTFYPETIRFNAGSEAVQRTEYDDKWAEGMYCLGDFLRNGGAFTNRRLYEELECAARVLEYESKHLKSRGDEVLRLSPKEDIKERLGRSPDVLDSAMMCAWVASDKTTESRTVPSTW